MCGRFTQHHDAGQIALRFEAQEVLFEPGARYNIAPSQPVAVVVTEQSSKERIIDGFAWGLVPFWAKDPGIGNKMINARAETVAEKPAFKNALRRRRCILPADGFYEWDKAGGTKQPYHFHRLDGELFGFAGLWEEWNPSEGGPPLRTCTILTTEANSLVARVHDRMPVILQNAEEEADWLNPEVNDVDELRHLLRPYPEEWMEAFAVSRRVNTPATDDPELLARATENST